MERLCEEHGTTVYNAKLLILGKRKICYVLDYGRITSKHCFHQFNNKKEYTTTTSPIKTRTNEWILIPDGWKIGFIYDKKIWIGKIKYFDDGVPKYSFCDPEQPEEEEWFKNPSKAFNNVLKKENYRHNGQLLIGVGYDNPQARLRERFRDFQSEDDSIQELFSIWLHCSKLEVVSISPIPKRLRVCDNNIEEEPKLKESEMMGIIRKISPLTDSKYVTWIYEALDKQFLSKTEFLNFLRNSEQVLEKEEPNSISKKDPRVLCYVIRLLREVTTLLPQRLPKADQIEYIMNFHK